MNDKLCQELKQVYEAPEPVGKRQFLRKIAPKKISLPHMLAVQCTYISKWVWWCFSLFLVVILYFSRFLQKEMLWVICASVPFLVMVSVTESLRSMACGMGELEMAARFSLKDVVLARMGILGAVNLFFLLLLAFIMDGKLWQNAFYILVPYLLTAFGSLAALRRFHGKEGSYVCAGIASAVSALEMIGYVNCKWIYETGFTGYWVLAAGVLLYMVIREGGRTIRMTAELM